MQARFLRVPEATKAPDSASPALPASWLRNGASPLCLLWFICGICVRLAAFLGVLCALAVGSSLPRHRIRPLLDRLLLRRGFVPNVPRHDSITYTCLHLWLLLSIRPENASAPSSTPPASPPAPWPKRRWEYTKLCKGRNWDPTDPTDPSDPTHGTCVPPRSSPHPSSPGRWAFTPTPPNSHTAKLRSFLLPPLNDRKSPPSV